MFEEKRQDFCEFTESEERFSVLNFFLFTATCVYVRILKSHIRGNCISRNSRYKYQKEDYGFNFSFFHAAPVKFNQQSFTGAYLFLKYLFKKENFFIKKKCKSDTCN